MTIKEIIHLATSGLEEVPADWMSATRARPFIFNDPAVVCFEFFGERNGFRPNESQYDFLKFIGEKGRQFESKWESEVAPNSEAVCIEDYQVRSQISVRAPVELMMKRTPVITKPAIWWAPERIYGVPDLIVHTSWLAQKFRKLIETHERVAVALNLVPAGKLGSDRAAHLKVSPTKARIPNLNKETHHAQKTETIRNPADPRPRE